MFHLKTKFRKNFFFILVADIFLFTLSYAASYLLRFDLKVPPSQYLAFRSMLIPILLLKLYVFYHYGLYQGMWRYTGLKDLENIIKASVISSLGIIGLILITSRFEGFPRSVFLIDCILTIFLIGGFRLAIRRSFQINRKGAFPWNGNKNGHTKKRYVLIIGAGDAGEKILREINDNVELNYRVIGFLDDDPKKIYRYIHDDPKKIYRYIHGVRVLGAIDEIISITKDIEIDEIIIAVPSASGDKMRRFIELCRKTGIHCKTIPSIGELINGKVSVSNIREVSYSDLLGRTPVELDMKKIGAYLKGKCVLITGAGGSIGSEFCRQVAGFGPQRLVMLDRAESSLYDIQMEIQRRFPEQVITPILSSVTSRERLQWVFSQYMPQVVFHAAAYKHVPMMEKHPWEAVYNNILGTKYTLEASIEAGVERFVLISTDKAVRPTNIMGTSKRIAELFLQTKYKEMLAGKGRSMGRRTKIMAVRFGNVIGSAGSVIPLFKRQIAHGGPVTVTDPEVTRYFMTINEAVQLILQAGAIGESGDIYILKMGKPVKIADMAKDLIRLSGFEPDKDIRIKVTGLRPGEKLYEELITEGEGIVPTIHEKLMVLRPNGNGNGGSGGGNGNGNGGNGHNGGNGNGGNGTNGGNGHNGSNGYTYAYLEKRVEELVELADNNDGEAIKLKLQMLVPEFTPLTNGAKITFRPKKKTDAKTDEVLADKVLADKVLAVMKVAKKWPLEDEAAQINAEDEVLDVVNVLPPQSNSKPLKLHKNLWSPKVADAGSGPKPKGSAKPRKWV